MQVSVFEGETLIGTATLEHLDPPMGVAFGPFAPTPAYQTQAHANVIEGEFVGNKGLGLAASADQHGTLNASIGIEDWIADEFGRQLTLFFKNGESFAALFADHPDYRAYFPDAANGS